MSSSPAPSRGWSPQRKAMTGGAIGVLALGFWLGTLFNGFGLGTGQSGDGDGNADQGGTPAVVTPEDVSVELGNPSLIGPASNSESPFPSGPVRTIAVLVRGDGYGLLINPPADTSTLSPPRSQHFQPASLEEIASLARTVHGNASGVKVQIVKHKSSTVGNDGALRNALRESEIPDDAIQIRSGFED
ncbi:MAG: hypothetical protein ACK5Q5_21675 [Planctomycetaceae bacterium]